MKKVFSKDLLFYFGAYFLGRVQAFVLVPLLAFITTSRGVGVYELFTTVALFLAVLLGFNLDSSLSMLYHKTDSEVHKRVILGNCLIFSFCILVVIIGLFFLASLVNVEFLKNPFGVFDYRLLAMTALFSFGSYLIQMGSLYLRLSDEKRLFSSVLLLQSSALLLPLTLLLVFKDKIDYLLAGQTLLIMALALFLIFKVKPVLRFDKKTTVRIAKLALPLIPFSFFAWVLLVSDRLILKHYWDVAYVGRYGVVNRLATVISVLGGPFQLLWLPFSLKLFHGDVDYKPVFKTLFNVIVIGGLTLIGGIYFAAELYGRFAVLDVDSSYVAPLAMANVFLLLSLFPTSSFLFSQKASKSSIAYGVGAVFSLAINFWLVPSFGLLGAVIGNYCGYVFMFCVAASLETSLTNVGYKYLHVVTIYTLVFCLVVFKNWGATFSGVVCILGAVLLGVALRPKYIDVKRVVLFLWRGHESHTHQ